MSSTPVPAPTFLLLAANDGASGIELWKTDGTAAGTALVKDINTTATLHSFPGEGGTLFPSEFIFLNGAWFFSADDGVTGPELWKSDGTEAGTVRVKDINPSPGAGSSPRGLTVFNNALYFSASDGSTGVELWKTDGTEGGTVRVKDIAPGVGSIGGILEPLSSSPSGFTVFNNALYFSADDGATGIELWKTDGTEGGTVRVKDINPGPGGSDPFRFTEFGSALYFSADDGVTGPELWKTDGTEGGTVRVKDINPGTEGNTVLVMDINPSTGSLVSELTVFGAALYFSADDGVSGPELWKTDGTNTMQVKDINTAPGAGSAPNALTVFNNALYFSANDGVTGRELWKTDGTDMGTMQVKDLCPGSCSGLPFLVILSVRNEALRSAKH